jgi:Holliday junction resolvasome RuvABC endonuclease subunit
MILGLDCATRTGFCLWSKGKIIESGTQDFTKQRGESNGMMFLKFRVWLNKLLLNFPITVVCFEQSHHRGGAATEIGVNLTGRVQEICAEHKIEYATVHTGTLKKYATGSGTASKEDMVKAASKLADRTITSDDEADAIWIAKYAEENYG